MVTRIFKPLSERYACGNHFYIGFEEMMVEQKPDEMVNHPNHYNQGEYEVIDVVEDWNLKLHEGTAGIYIARAPHKGNEIQDLEKAVWYLNRRIGLLRKQRQDAEHVAGT